MSVPILKKRIYRLKDFDEIYWHDSCIFHIEFDNMLNRIKLYLDLIVEPAQASVPEESGFNKLWVLPAVVVFGNITECNFKLEVKDTALDLNISYIQRELVNSDNKLRRGDEYKYSIEFTTPIEGKFIINSVADFQMHLIGEPIMFESEKLYYEKRNVALSENIDYIEKI